MKIQLSTQVLVLVLSLFIAACGPLPTPSLATETPDVTSSPTVTSTPDPFGEQTAIAEKTQGAEQGSIIYMPTPGNVTSVPTSAINKVTPIPTSAISNVVKYFDFEGGPQQFISLGVCDSTSSDEWWNFCYDAPSKLIQAEDGFTGQYGLGIQAELLPEKEQVYTVRFLIDPPQFADALSAVLYIPDTDQVSWVNFAAWYVGGTQWSVSTLNSDRTGWSYIYLDLQQAATDSAISEIHIDWFLPGADLQSVETLFMIDDLRFYYPASVKLESNP